MMDEIAVMKRGRYRCWVVTGATSCGPRNEPQEYTTVVIRSNGEGLFRISGKEEVRTTFGEAAGLREHYRVVTRLVGEGWRVQGMSGGEIAMDQKFGPCHTPAASRLSGLCCGTTIAPQRPNKAISDTCAKSAQVEKPAAAENDSPTKSEMAGFSK